MALVETLVKDLEATRLATETWACLVHLALRTVACADPSLDPHGYWSESEVPTECVIGVLDPMAVPHWNAMVRCCLDPASVDLARYPAVP